MNPYLRQTIRALVICTAVLTASSPAGSMPLGPESMNTQIANLIEAVRGQRVGLLTNPTGVDGQFTMLADILHADPQTTLVCFFAPEHGLRGDKQAGAGITDYIDPVTSLPVYALYSVRVAPTDEQLATIDALVFNIQDVGARFYTYVWTMTHAMEACARNGKKFVVFDRPNPIGGLRVEGAPNPGDYGLIGRKWPNAPFGIATRHGMTAGEIAKLVNTEWMSPKVDLQVITMPGYLRDMEFHDTGRPWVIPSPNMPTLDTAVVYPGTCVFEGTNLSEGRGTTKPFEFCAGAPFVDGLALAANLNALGLPGVRFRPVYFRPTFSKFSGQDCSGVQVHVTDKGAFEPVRTGLHILKTVYTMYPSQVTINDTASRLMGVPNLHQRIKTEPVEAIIAGWQADLEAFKAVRQNHLLYPAASAGGQWRTQP